MRKLRTKISYIIIFSFLCAFSHNALATNRNLTIFAEQSMMRALTKLATVYAQKNNVAISINFNSSFELINEIDLGEPADVFITGHTGLVEKLKQKGLVDIYSVTYIAQDKLNLVTSKNNPDIAPKLLQSSSLKDSLKVLDNIRASVIIDQEESTSGLSSNTLITSLSLKKLKLFQKLPEDKTAIIDIIHNDPQNYALLLSSQVKNKKDLMVLSEAQKNDVFYKALAIAGNNMEISREFLRFLKSNEAKQILIENGLNVN